MKYDVLLFILFYFFTILKWGLDMNISKLFRRFWAYCFDLMIVCGIYSGILLLINVLDINNTLNKALQGFHAVLSKGISSELLNEQAFYIALFSLSYGLLFLAYEITFLSSKLSATPGKLILGVEVGCSDKVIFFKVFVRSLLKVLSTLIIPLAFVSFIVSAFSQTRQSLHDKLASTYVTALNAPNHGTAPHMTLEEFFEEMTSRGMRLYSEQLALAEEIYGSRIIEPEQTNSQASVVGVLALVLSIIINLSFISYSYSDIENYVKSFRTQYTQKF